MNETNGDDDGKYVEREDMYNALAKMKLGMSAGDDKIAPEMLKYAGEEAEEMLYKVN